MVPCLEFEGKNLADAIAKACAALHISAEKLNYDVISHGSTGIFGLVGSKKARISVTSTIQNLENKTERINSESIINDRQIGNLDDQINKDIKLSNDFQSVEEKVDSIELGRNVLQRIIDFITTDATISVKERSGKILYFIEGGNPAVLIGKRGQTLEAIQYIVKKIIKKNDKKISIQIDVEGYLKNRKASLELLATNLSEKVKRTGKPATIGQMNAHDRRIVHLTLKEDNSVRTQSVGDSYLRKLVIIPRKKSSQKRQE